TRPMVRLPRGSVTTTTCSEDARRPGKSQRTSPPQQREQPCAPPVCQVPCKLKDGPVRSDTWREKERGQMDPREAQMVYTPKKVNHLLHLILTILTAGLWGIV